MVKPRTPDAFAAIIKTAANISRATTGGEVAHQAQAEASLFLLKNLLSCLSIRRISAPVRDARDPVQAPYYDYSSMQVLVRSLAEGYVNMYNLLIAPDSPEELDFGMLRWELHGLVERQRVAGQINSKHPKLVSEAKRIDKLRSRIEAHQMYKAFGPKHQKAILESKSWTDLSFDKLAARTDIHPSWTNATYKYLSGYAHAQRLSLLQVGSIRGSEEARQMMRVPLSYAELYLSLTVLQFIKCCPQCSSLVDNEGAYLCGYWDLLSRESINP